MARSRNWTESERQTLREMWDIATVTQIAKALNRVESSIYSKGRELNLGKHVYRDHCVSINPETLQLAENVFATDPKSFSIISRILYAKHSTKPHNRNNARSGHSPGHELQDQDHSQPL